MSRNNSEISRHLRLDHLDLSSWRQAALSVCRTRKAITELSVTDGVCQLIRQEKHNIESLWEVFTTERNEIGRYLLDPKKQAAAYLLGFHLSNQARAKMLLNRAFAKFNPKRLDGYRRISVTDIGCGSGAASAAFFSFIRRHTLPDVSVEFSLIDKSRAFLTAATKILDGYPLQGEIKPQIGSRQQDLEVFFSKEKLTSGGSDNESTLRVILMSNVWNEIQTKPKTLQLAQRWLEQVSKVTHPLLVVVLEPANQHIARESMGLRDFLVSSGLLPLYPCPHSKSCPMLERSRDWCYSEGDWELPKEQKIIDKILGVDHQRIHTSGYVFSNDLFGKREGQAGSVVVGLPLRSKAKFQHKHAKVKRDLLVCRSSGLLDKAPAPTTGPLPQRGESWIL